MRLIIFIFLFSPSVLLAQNNPRFENDTLYTSGGYKIYRGQTLKFAEGTGKKGKFRSVKVKGYDYPDDFTNNYIVVEDLSEFYISEPGNAYIRIRGKIITENGKKKKRINFNLAFEKAIEGFQGLKPELIVPEEFKLNLKSKPTNSIADELAKLYKLYQDGVITKEEFETQKKKLLDQ